jgi:hypothetical protein
MMGSCVGGSDKGDGTGKGLEIGAGTSDVTGTLGTATGTGTYQLVSPPIVAPAATTFPLLKDSVGRLFEALCSRGKEWSEEVSCNVSDFLLTAMLDLVKEMLRHPGFKEACEACLAATSDGIPTLRLVNPQYFYNVEGYGCIRPYANAELLRAGVAGCRLRLGFEFVIDDGKIWPDTFVPFFRTMLSAHFKDSDVIHSNCHSAQESTSYGEKVARTKIPITPQKSGNE